MKKNLFTLKFDIFTLHIWCLNRYQFKVISADELFYEIFLRNIKKGINGKEI